MHLWFRLLWLLIGAFFRPRLTLPADISDLPMRVLPTDLDTNGHMNNGRYLTLMDLGRMDLIVRAGMLDAMRKRMWAPVLGAAQIRYRLPLDLFVRFRLQTRILCWQDPWFYIEQRFVIAEGSKAGAVAAIALVKGSFYDTKASKTVAVSEALSALGMAPPSPPMPSHIQVWQQAEEALRAVTASTGTATTETKKDTT